VSMLRITTWNINSVRLRLPLILRFLQQVQPDVLCLQEIKCVDDSFPAKALAAAGYTHQYVHGMKGYNGVAILARKPFSDQQVYHRCGREDRRHISVRLQSGVELHNVYLPAGGYEPDPVANPKFQHKLDYIDDLAAWGAELKRDTRLLVGDLNVAPLERDVYDHKKMLRVVSHTPVEVEKFAAMQAAHDWVDVGRHFVPADQKLYSWWSYHGKDEWDAKDYGRRLDHIWATPDLTGALQAIDHLREVRGWTHTDDSTNEEAPTIVGPSDHVPVTVALKVR
jgi:exodeoxyribonuclease-3